MRRSKRELTDTKDAERFPGGFHIRRRLFRVGDDARRAILGPRGPTPPPFPPAADVIAAEGAKTTPACDSAVKARGASRVARRRSLGYFSHDASRGEPPNACGAARVPSAADDRDVVFVVDASDAMGPEAFRGKTMDALQSLYCASHEGSQSRAAVVLYPAPKRARATSSCGAYQVAIPLARYTPLEWRDLVENLRRDPEACCGASDGEGTHLTAAAPLAEALDGAGLELAERGAHDPSKRLVVVVSAGLPSPMVRDESCAEDADPTFASMTRDVPFSRAASDGGEVTACTYPWRHVPRRRTASKRRAAIAVVTPRRAGAGSSPRGPPPRRLRANRGSARVTRTGSVRPGGVGGERGRWVYRGSSEAEKENAEKKDVDEKNAVSRVDAFGFGGLGLPTFASVARLGSADASDRFAYDPGEPETCVANLPSGDAATRGRAVVSFPISAHLVTLHGDADGWTRRDRRPRDVRALGGALRWRRIGDGTRRRAVRRRVLGGGRGDVSSRMVHARTRDEEVREERGEERGGAREERERDDIHRRVEKRDDVHRRVEILRVLHLLLHPFLHPFSTLPPPLPPPLPPLGSRDECVFQTGDFGVERRVLVGGDVQRRRV